MAEYQDNLSPTENAERAAGMALADCWATHPTTPGPDPNCCTPNAVAAARPHLWHEVAAWVRETCEDPGPDGEPCEACESQAWLIDDHADRGEERHG